MATETELKLFCLPEAITLVESHPLIAKGGQETSPKRLENTYFDTPDLSLYASRIALRVRKTPAEQLQTVKCAAESVAGLSSRPEWETSYDGCFDFTGVDDSDVRAFLQERQTALIPVFTTTFERKAWKVDISKKTSLWVMIDQGEVVSDGRSLQISEVELELAEGSPKELLDFARRLATDLPLLPNDISKAERGYQLFLNQAPCAARAGQSAITPGQTAAEAFEALAWQQLQMWQTNQLGILTVNAPEFVHQFRVALRRLGSLLKVFKPVLPDRFGREWKEKLKALSQITGDVRNLDVMSEAILQPIVQSGSRKAHAQAIAALAVCDADKQSALAQFEQLRYGGLLLHFARDLQVLTQDDFPKNLDRFAEKRLAALYRKVCKAQRRALKSTTPEHAHRLRIALKHLRYSCEFFAPLFDQEAMQRQAKAIANLQDELGFVNDVYMAKSQLQRWIDEGKISTATRDCVTAWHAQRVDGALGRALLHTESLLGNCLPWCRECERRGRLSRR